MVAIRSNKMKFSKVIFYPRGWNPQKYPVLAHLDIEAELMSDIERLIDDMTQAKVIGHDLAAGGRVVLHVACTSSKVKRLIESRWT